MRIHIATGAHERARFLEGAAEDGLDLVVHPFLDDAARHIRFLAGEFDACELSLGIYVARRAQGEPWTALPVFPNRRFRHSFVYIRRDRGIHRPKDLEGKRVGLVSWFNTAALWVRGMLAHDYGVDLSAIDWVLMRPPEVPGWRPPRGLRLEFAEPGPSLESRLLDGTLDAMIQPEVIGAVKQGHPGIGRLFEDYFERERAYYQRTGILPISHLVALRQSVVDAHPDLPRTLWQAWIRATAAALDYADDPGHSNLMWYGYIRELEASVLGGVAWDYRLEPHRPALEAFLAYCYEQGLLDSPWPDVATLFHPGVLDIRDAQQSV